jgi:hypothetical protein
MTKLTVLTLLATIGLAAPALAQTPADLKNNRTTAKEEMTTAPVVIEPAKETAKPAKKSKKKSKKKTVKKEEAAPAAAEAMDAKKDEKGAEKK